jgi:membrane-bound lytic murein transglycosylase A
MSVISLWQRAAVTLLILSTAACSVVPQAGTRSATTPPPVAAAAKTESTASAPLANANNSGFANGPDVASLAISEDGARRALAAFRISCPSLVKRTDRSGLTQPEQWQNACSQAANWPDGEARRFFIDHFRTVQVSDGRAFATGYYEPEIRGSRTPGPGYAVPIYARPDDLVDVDLGQFNPQYKGRSVRGRVVADKLVLYHDRTAIEAGALAGRGLELGYAADPIALFFLQVQGSGRVRLPDGQVLRIGYASQNGRDYVGIGGLLKARGVLAPGQASMQGIIRYLRTQPDGGRAIMQENPSYVFFRELTGPGPLGAMGLPVTPRATVAADPLFVPLGAPVWLALDRAEANGLWVAQDTGGAIKGANRFDTFWGAGDDAARIAGGMSGRGQAYLLLPR